MVLVIDDLQLMHENVFISITKVQHQEHEYNTNPTNDSHYDFYFDQN